MIAALPVAAGGGDIKADNRRNRVGGACRENYYYGEYARDCYLDRA